MSKKPKPKSEGCRLKVLWTLLLGFLLFGASNASAASATLIFNYPEANISSIEILNDDTSPATGVTWSGNEATVTYSGLKGYIVKLPSYPISVEETVGKASLLKHYADLAGDTYWQVDLNNGSDGAVITFTSKDYVPPTTDPDPEPGDGNYVNLNFGGVNDAYQYVYLMNNDEYADDADQFYTTNENPTKWTYTFNKEGLAGVTLAAQKGYRISSITCSNSSLKNANQDEGGDYYIQDISGASGYSLAPATSPNYSGAWTIDFYNEKVSGATFNVTLEKASDPVYFTIETSDAVAAALKALDDQPQVAFGSYTINPDNIGSIQNVDIAGNSFTYYYTEGQPTPLRLSLNNNLEPGSDYEIVVTSDLPEGTGTYTVTYTRGKYGQNPIATINLYDGCINGKFTIKAQKVGEAVEPAEPVVATGSYDGTYTQENNGVKTNYPYTFNYSISFTPGAAAARYAATQADEVTGTLSITGKFTWANGNAPVGYVGGLSATVPGIPGGTGNVDSQDQTINLTASFKEGETITINFSSAVANGLVEVPVTYTVGTEDTTTPEPEAVEFKSQTPANESTVELGADGTVSFTLEFTGDVTIEKATAGMRGNVQLGVEPATGSASSFTFTFPKAYIDDLLIGYVPGETEARIFGNVYAKDAEGNYVSNSVNDDISVQYVLNVDLQYGVDFNVSVDNTAENQLNTFTVAPAEGFVSIAAYENADESDSLYGIKITNQSDFEAKATGFENGVVTFSPAIIESGKYTINFPYHAFDVTKTEGTGSEDEGTASDEGDKVYPSMEKTYEFDVTIEGGASSGDTLPLEDNNFFPKANEKYTFTPTENGVLTVKPMEYGEFTSTTILGGLYTSDGTFVPASKTDGSDLGWGDGYSEMSYADYNLTAGQTYYWTWSKNSSGDDYALYATFGKGSEEPTPSDDTLILDSKEFFPKANEQYTYTPTEEGVLTVKPMEYGEFTSTTVLGGLYTSDGTFVPASKTDGSDLGWGDGYSDMSYADYNLTTGQTYYWTWSKNSSGDDYALYATFSTGGSDEPEQPGDDSDYTLNPEQVAPGETWPSSVQVIWDDQTVVTNTASPNYNAGMGAITNIPLYLNGELAIDPEFKSEVNLYASAVYWVDEGGWGWWDNASEDNPGSAISIGGFPYFDTPTTEGETMLFTIPAGSFLINGLPNEDIVVKYVAGDVEYDDSKVKTYGSTVTFNGPNSCEFITHENDVAPLAIISDSEEDLSEYISLVYKVDPNNSAYDKDYSFVAVRMDDGKIAYNFKQVTDNQMTFTYTGNETVTFTFQKELVNGEQLGGLQNAGEFIWDKAFTLQPNQVKTYTFTEPVPGQDAFIMIDTNVNLLENGTLTVMNAGDESLLNGWKSGEPAKFQLISAKNGTYGYTGTLGISYAPYTVYVAYTGEEPLTLTLGWGLFTENGVAEYLDPAEQTPTTVTTADKNAVITLDWDQEMEVVNAGTTMRYSINGVDELGSSIEFSNFMYFEGEVIEDPDINSTISIKDGSKGNPLKFRFGAAFGGELQVGTYAITLPSAVLKNADGEFNCEQIITVNVVEAPELPAWTSDPANNSDSEDFMDFLQVFWGYKELELVGENWKNIKATFNVMEDVPILSANINDYSTEGIEGVEGSNTVYENAALGLYFDVDPFSLGQTGSWQITIPANVVLVDVDGVKIPNEAITINFNRVTINWYENDITVNPKPETDVYELGKITLTFPEDAAVSVNDVVNTFVRIDGGERIELSADNFEAKGNVVTVDISEYVDAYATYELTIADKVLDIFFDYTTWSNKDLTYTWNYVPVPLVVSEITPEDGSIMGGAGTIYIDFDQAIYVNGELAPKNPSYISLDVTKVKVTINGQEQTLNGNGGAGSPYLRAINNTATNEQNGGAEEINVGQLQFNGGDMAFWWWKGNVDIVIPAGLVANAAGGTNEEITLHYSFNDVVENTAITWTPDMDAAMYQDEAEVKATWNGYTVSSLITNPTYPIYVRSTEEDATGDRKVVTPTIDNGSLVFNFKQLEPGEYELVIPEGTVSLGDNTINGDAIYTFTIKPLPVYLGLADSGFPMQYDTANELVSNDKGQTFTGTFEIKAGQSFNLWWKSSAMGMDMQQGYQTGFLPLGPASDKEVKLTFTEKDENLSEALDLAMEGYFTLGNNQDLSLTLTLDMDTRKLTILNNTEIEESAPEYLTVAIGTGYSAFPAVKDGDVKLLPSAENPNIYEGTIQIGKMKAFAFYTPDGTSYTATSTSNYCSLSWAFGSDQFEWPSDYDANIAKSHLSQNNSVRMYFGSFTGYPSTATTADVTIRVNWEEQTFAMTLTPYVAPAPEELYLFGTTGGYTGQARYSNMATLTKAAGANVYTLENFEVPACGIFVPDGENKAPNGAPDYGFYFFLNDHKTSMTSGTRYLAPAAAEEGDANPAIIDLSSSDNTYTVTTVSGTTNGGSNFIALTPGLYNFTFNFDTKQFTAVLAEEYNQVTFKFEGEGLEKNPYTYVKAMSMFDGQELKFVDPEYLYSYSQQAGVSFAAIEGYQLKITCANAQPGEGVYSINSQNMDGAINTVLGLYPGANGFVFTITVSEIPEEPSLIFDDFDMTFTKGSEDAVTVTVPVSLDIADPFEYKGFQFDITLPLNFKATAVTVNSGINLGQNGSATVVPYTKDVPENTYRVLAHFGTATAITDDIATLTISGVYNDQMVNEQEYDVTIQNTVIFSTATGSDITNVNGYTGTVTVYIEIPAEEITFDKVELVEPSYTDKTGNVTEVTQGESVDMTITVEPAETTDDLEVSADNGAVVTFDEETGTWNVDTSGVEVAEGEEVTVTVTAKAGDVEETYELKVKGVLLGDSNANGVVTVADVVTTANYISEAAYDNFCFPNANVILTEVDGKQVINAQDLSATINIVLKTWDGQREINARRYANRSFTNDRLVASDFHAGNSVIGINLENTMNYSVLQATVEIPAGMKIQNVTVGPRAAAHELVYNVKGDELHVVLFSYENASFRGGEGSLFNIAVVADENCGDLQMKNILASDAASNGYELSFEGGMNAGTTGIDGIDADAEGVRYFTVDGIEVFNPEAGQILIRVANGSAEKVIIK